MLISSDNNLSQLKTCTETAHHFLLSENEARKIFKKQKSVIEDNWESICDEAELSEVDRMLLWKRQFLNPFSIQEN
ncbi:MAG: hypothetical protein HOD92_15880 [Deltaproteobacteria bacterium]|nr:hypothetical protein [Deltaproteobacteria bacterium]